MLSLPLPLLPTVGALAYPCGWFANIPGSGWIWPFGTIAAATVAGIYGDKAVKAKNAYLAAEAELLLKNEEIASLVRCIGLVTHASTQIVGVDKYIARALKALDHLSRMSIFPLRHRWLTSGLQACLDAFLPISKI